MAWFRIDDQAAFHAKVLMAGNEAYGAWCRAGAWSSGHGTNGRIPRAVALTIAPERVWKRLVEAGLAREGDDSFGIVEGLWSITAAREPIPRGVREQVLSRDGLVCGICGGTVEPHDVHIDHVVRCSRGGSNAPRNLQVAHSLCNLRKGARLLS